jgi:hypothetical protein
MQAIVQLPGYNAAMSDVTRILSAVERGDENAVDKLLPLVYQELRRLATANGTTRRHRSGAKFRVQGRLHSPTDILFGITTNAHGGSFATLVIKTYERKHA